MPETCTFANAGLDCWRLVVKAWGAATIACWTEWLTVAAEDASGTLILFVTMMEDAD